ncbi:MAG: type II secretion system protein [Candidatus Eremiobacteraeota bacterium]|nr:type II secretion system protein [Candidatus Eremiobacteraeota bacterium]MCW5868620.1 type II secretion system protein [Candidatus Eremiobacteraeota bacterium]
MKRRAFTFLEALVTLALVAVAFGALMIMLLEAFRIARKSSDKTASAEAAELGLERMASEAREALVILEPAVGAANIINLRFHKINPDNSLTHRLPDTPPLPDPAGSWNPFMPAYLLEVHYTVVSESLVREVGPVGGTPSATMTLCDHIRGLKVARPRPAHLTLELSVQDGRTVLAHSTEVICHAVP